MALLRQILVNRESEGAAIVRTRQISPMPLSHLAFTLMMDYPASFEIDTVLDTLEDNLNRVSVYVEGDAVVSVRGAELPFLNAHLWGIVPQPTNDRGANTAVRSAVTALIPFGRRLYDPDECLPAFPQGQVELQYDLPALGAGATTRLIAVTAVYLPGATPTKHLRYRDLVRSTQTVGFVNDLSLPVSHKLLGLLIREASAETTTANGTVNQFRLLGDDRDIYVQTDDWHSVWAESRNRAEIASIDRRVATENTAAVYTQNATTNGERSIQNTADGRSKQYSYLDFDWNRDGAHALETTQFRALTLRIDAQETGEIRVIPILLVETTGA